MSISQSLLQRSESKCELCFSENQLQEYLVPPKTDEIPDNQAVICDQCLTAMSATEPDVNYWRCLNESMWTQIPAVQVVIHRLLGRLSSADWAADALSQMYLDEETLDWSSSGQSDAAIVHKDVNGHILQAGDTVTLIQDLNVKGSSLTAKRGTAVRRIRLDPDNSEYIEGKVDGQHIVILTKYVKKSS